MTTPIFCFEIMSEAGLTEESSPHYIQISIEDVLIVNQAVYDASHKQLCLLLAMKFEIDVSFIKAISINEYNNAYL